MALARQQDSAADIGGRAGPTAWPSALAPVPAVGDWFTNGVFHAIAGATIVAAVATISFRSPVYSEIWFGMTLTGAADCSCWPGPSSWPWRRCRLRRAILVTLLFVFMLLPTRRRYIM